MELKGRQTKMQDRVHQFDGIRNFRDFGGYKVAGGRTIMTGRLYRSAQFGEATVTDIEALGRLNIRVQADLRRPDERERHGHAWPVEGVRVLSSTKGRAKEAPHVRFLSEVAVDAPMAHQWMIEYYQAAPYKPQHVDLFSEWFSALVELQPEQAAVVNCAAGKDRTGILCALTHYALGADRDTIVADYELTNEAADVAERLPEMARMFNAHIGKSHAEEVYHPFVGVSVGFLEAAMAQIEKQSGSVDAYLEETLGIGSDQRQILEQNFLI